MDNSWYILNDHSLDFSLRHKKHLPHGTSSPSGYPGTLDNLRGYGHRTFATSFYTLDGYKHIAQTCYEDDICGNVMFESNLDVYVLILS